MAPAADEHLPWCLKAVHTAVPGRARFRLQALRGSPELVRDAANAVRGMHGVRGVRGSASTGTLLVSFAADEAPEQFTERLASRLRRALHMPVAAETADKRPAARAAPPPAAERRRPARTMARQFAAVSPKGGEGKPWHAMPRAAATEALGADIATGLARAAAKERLERLGPNLLPQLAAPSRLDMLLRQITTVPVGMLGVSGAVALATGGILDAAAIAAVVAINALIGYSTERKSEATIAALAAGTPQQAPVLRDGGEHSIPLAELVAGDLLILRPGTYIGADARVLRGDRLTVDESPLTGESMPVGKHGETVLPVETALGDRSNMVYRGTTVTGGSGLALVVETGPATELGRIQTAAGGVQAPETPMQRQLDDLGTQLALLSALACAGVFGVGVLRRHGVLEMLKSSISLGVAAVPEGLPTVATTTLALGIREMSARRVAVRELGAVEALGAVGVFCLDKTGTLTENRMEAVAVHVGNRRYAVSEGVWNGDGEVLAPMESATARRLLEVLALCNESQLDGAGPGPELHGTPTENALLRLGLDAGLDVAALRRRHPLLATRYRSEQQRYMVTQHRAGRRRLVAVKGSPAEVLPMCRWIELNGRRRRLGEQHIAALLKENERWAGEALRVLGVAVARIGATEDWEDAGLTWLGLAGLTDPIRAGMPELMSELHTAGIRTVMITGDQSATAYAVGRALGIAGDEPLQIMDSTQLDRLPPDLREALAQKTHVFARVSPSHKLEVVQALQRAGQVVAMTGDGINDGPALKAADVGVAMGGSGQDVARALADVVLEDDRLETMLTAVGQGRSIYANIRKALHFLLSTNFSEIEVMLTAVALGLPPPLNPIQLLWVNLVTDVFPGLALALEPQEPDVLARPPRDPAEPIISNEDLKVMALESGVITASSMASYLWGLMRYGPGPSASSLAFTSLTTAQLLHALACRSEHAGLLAPAGATRNPYLEAALGATLLIQAGTLAVPPLRRLLGLGPIGFLDLPVMFAGAVGPLLCNDWLKRRRLARSAEGPGAAGRKAEHAA